MTLFLCLYKQYSLKSSIDLTYQNISPLTNHLFDTMPNTILYIILLYVLPLYIVLFNCVSLSRSVRLVSFLFMWQISPICFIYAFVLIMDSDITSHRVVIGLFYHKTSCNNVAPVTNLCRQSYNAVPFVTMEQKKSCSWNIKTHYLRFKHFIITITDDPSPC